MEEDELGPKKRTTPVVSQWLGMHAQGEAGRGKLFFFSQNDGLLVVVNVASNTTFLACWLKLKRFDLVDQLIMFSSRLLLQSSLRYILFVEQDRRDSFLGNSVAFITSKGEDFPEKKCSLMDRQDCLLFGDMLRSDIG